jgi:hypothetical protein
VRVHVRPPEKKTGPGRPTVVFSETETQSRCDKNVIIFFDSSHNLLRTQQRELHTRIPHPTKRVVFPPPESSAKKPHGAQ